MGASACHWILSYLSCHLCKSLSFVIATWFSLCSHVEIPDSQIHQSLLQKYDENQWRNLWIGTLIFLLSGHKPENLIWLSKLAMQLNLVIQRKIRSQPFFSVTVFILENATIAAKVVKVSFYFPFLRASLCRLLGGNAKLFGIWHP